MNIQDNTNKFINDIVSLIWNTSELYQNFF